MDLQSSIAVSLLPGISRIRAAAVFKDLRDSSGDPDLSLDEVIEACASARRRHRGGRPRARGDAARRCSTGAAQRRHRAASLGRRSAIRRCFARSSIRRRCCGCGATSAVLDPAGGRHRRFARGDAVRAGSGRAARGRARRSAACWSSSAAWRAASTGGAPRVPRGRRRDGRGPRLRARRHLSAGARELAASICRNGALVSELGPGRAAASGALSAAQPDHQRDLARGRGGRSRREERLADHRPLRAGAGPRRDGGAGQRPQRPQPRSPRPLKDGAKVVESADDILEELGWPALRRGTASEGPATQISATR